MAETPQIPATRADAEIEADIEDIYTTYPPLMHDHRNIKVAVEDGIVTIRGYVKAQPTHIYFMNKLKHVRGVNAFNTDEFHNDEVIRLDVGQVIPVGVYVLVEYGSVILSGKLPEDVEVSDLVKKVGLVDGVRRVLTRFS